MARQDMCSVLIETLWNVKVAGVAEDPWPDVPY